MAVMRTEVGSGRAGRPTLVVRLIDDCPGALHALAPEIEAAQSSGVVIEVVPSVPLHHAIAAYAGIPLATPDSPALALLCSHHAPPDLSFAAAPDVTVVIRGTLQGMADLAHRLLVCGRDPDTPTTVVEHGTTIRQRSQRIRLADLPDLLPSGLVAEPVVAILGKAVGRPARPWFETRPLHGWRVLLPRTKDRAAPMVSRLASYGAHAELVPTIAVEPPRTRQPMQKAITGLVTGRYEWIGFTSVNAVRAVREKLTELGLDARAFSGLKIAAVGGVTADALREWGIEPDLIPSGEQSALGLLADWPPYDPVLDPINRVLLPRADIATDTLIAGLQDMGWEVDDVTAYRTVRAAPPPAPIREAIKRGDFDAVLFTSSSTVRNLIGIAGKPHPTTVVGCIGPATARTAEEHGLVVSVLAPEASAVSLIDALARYGRSLSLAAAEAGERPRRPSTRRRKARS